MKRRIVSLVVAAVAAVGIGAGIAPPALAEPGELAGTVSVEQRVNWNWTDYLPTTDSTEALDVYSSPAGRWSFFDASRAGDLRYRPVFRARYVDSGKHLPSLAPEAESPPAANEGILGYLALSREDAFLPDDVVRSQEYPGFSTCWNDPIAIHRIYDPTSIFDARYMSARSMRYGNEIDEGVLGWAPRVTCDETEHYGESDLGSTSGVDY
ncbi:MAG TPA: hypothetical protein VD813_05135 [Pseudonocardia sp.]|nr:hypothetical protein [Pseudonocardia sp.]